MWRRRVGGYPHVTKMSVTFRERARKTDTACQIMFVYMSGQVFTDRKRQPVIAVVVHLFLILGIVHLVAAIRLISTMMVRSVHNSPIPSPPTRSYAYGSPARKIMVGKSNVRVVVRIRPLNSNEASHAPIIYPIDTLENITSTEPPLYGSPTSDRSVLSVGNSVLSTTSSQRSFTFRRPKVLQKLLNKNRDSKQQKKTTSSTIGEKTKILKPAASSSDMFLQTNEPLKASSGKLAYPTLCWASDRTFTFDAVYGPTVTQQEFYRSCFGETLLTDLLEYGYNTTIIAYGMTGAGKSHTMSNVDGVIYHAVSDLFRDKEGLKKDISVKLSCFEIYIEDVKDLLGHDVTNVALKIRDSGDNVSVIGLSEITVDHIDQVRELLDHAQMRRTTSSTGSNQRSSRSHAIYSLTIQSSNGLPSKPCTSKLTFVDLAGSERIKDSGVIGNQRKESIHINTDLFALSKVISSLHDQNSHIPYRDCKLTRLLRDSLGGNCRTILIACISPAKVHADESLNTLRYAERAQSIPNSIHASVSKSESVLAMTPTQIASIQEENNILRARLASISQKHTISDLSTGKASAGIGIDVSGLEKKVQMAREEAANTRFSCNEVATTADRLRERLNLFQNKNSTGQRKILGKLEYQELEAMCATLRQELNFVNSENDILRHQNIRLQEEIQRLRSAKSTSDAIEQPDSKNQEEEDNLETDPKCGLSSDHVKIRSHAERLLNWADKAIQKGRHENSTNTSEGTDLRPLSQNDACAISRARSNAENRENEFYISNMQTVRHSPSCPCQDSLAVKQTEVADFYLPKLGTICTCGQKDEVPLVNDDPSHLENILREWQIEFLKTRNIHTAVDLLHAYTQDSHGLAKSMRIWRTEKGLMSIKTKSCCIALRIWARTCKVVLQMEQGMKAEGGTTRADFLNISLASDATSISTLGFPSSITDA
jgi:Kinesin motor domain